jgi:beta-glucosidase
MKSMGLQTYRFSTSWSRVRPDWRSAEPSRGDFYKRLADETAGCRHPALAHAVSLGPSPGAPGARWLDQRETPTCSPSTALDMHDASGDRVNVWTTLNEPWCSSIPLLHRGCARPGTTARARACSPRTTCCSATARRSASCGHATRRSNLGITLNLTVADAVDRERSRQIDAARRDRRAVQPLVPRPDLPGRYPADILEDFRVADARAALEAAILPATSRPSRRRSTPSA